jgi:IMP dehydrogenase
MRILQEALTFDDVLLLPAHSSVLPKDVDLKTSLTRTISLNIPLLSAAMDTVTESRAAICLAQEGGLGVIHKNLTPARQAEEVHRVKKFEAGIISNPITVTPDTTIRKVLELTRAQHISGVPVTQGDKLVGIVTSRDLRFETRYDEPVSRIMTPQDKLITVKEGAARNEILKLLHQHRIEKILVVDDKFGLKGLITVKDIQKSTEYPRSAKDPKGRLRVGAAVGVGQGTEERVERLVEADVDVIVVDGVKVGIGPGSICTTRMVAGVGVPQLTAISNVVEALKGSDIPVIADGGIRYSGDIAKALAAGANTIMIGSLLAGTDESPGQVEIYQGRSYKSYRGMGSLGAMGEGSSDRYFQEHAKGDKLVPEGVEGRVPYKGPMINIIHQLMGGLRSSMGYTGSADIEAMRTKTQFVRITNAGIRESHVHDVMVTKEAPNYQRDS